MNRFLPGYAKALMLALLCQSAPSWAVDPNCNANVAPNGAINNYFGAPSPAQRQNATDAIAQLDFGDLYRAPPFRINVGAVRLDAQGLNAAGDANWQVQINGVHGNSSIAHAQIAGTLGFASTADRQAYIQRIARNALVQSLNTGNRQDATGICN